MMTDKDTAAAKYFQTSHWIWPAKAMWDLRNCYALFRKAFTLEKIPDTASIAITADQSYQLYVNSQFVCRGPARGFQSHWPYDVVDIRPYLITGKNVIGVRAHNPGYSNFSYIFQGFAGLLIGTETASFPVKTDDSWDCLLEEAIIRDTVVSSIQLFPQEHFDSRLEVTDWLEPDCVEEVWQRAPLGPVWNAAPWTSLEPRDIPLLQEKCMQAGRVIGVSAGTSLPGYASVRDVAFLHHQENVSHKPTDFLPLTSPLAVSAMNSGEYRSYLVDFDRTMVGSIEIEIASARGGEIVDFVYGETVDPVSLRIDQEFPHYCRIAFGGRLFCRAGKNRHRFYHPYGFRYLVVAVRGAIAPIELDLKFHWIGYPIEDMGRFESSEPLLNKIWAACQWTQQCCSLDAFVDTPWREQAQWWGDARVQARNMFFLSGDVLLFRRGLRQIGGQTLDNGLTYGHAPTFAHNCVLPDFTLIWFITHWDYYWQTNSLEPFIENQKIIEKALTYFEEQIDPHKCLIPYDPRFYLFLDSAEVFKKGFGSIYNLLFLSAIGRLSELYSLSGQKDKAAHCEALGRRIRNGLASLIKDGLFVDGLTRDGETVSSHSVHAQTLAISIGAWPDLEKGMMADVILPYLQGSVTDKSSPSAFWSNNVLDVAKRRGFGSEVISFIRQRWEEMAAYGTCWEDFSVHPGGHSRSHAWAAHPLVHLLEILSGVSQSAVNWTEIQVAPIFFGDSFRGTMPTPFGNIQVDWRKTSKCIEYCIDIPEGISATIHLSKPAMTGATGRHCFAVEQSE